MIRDVGLPGSRHIDEMAGAELLGRQGTHHGGSNRIGEYPQEIAVEIDIG